MKAKLSFRLIIENGNHVRSDGPNILNGFHVGNDSICRIRLNRTDRKYRTNYDTFIWPVIRWCKMPFSVSFWCWHFSIGLLYLFANEAKHVHNLLQEYDNETSSLTTTDTRKKIHLTNCEHVFRSFWVIFIVNNIVAQSFGTQTFFKLKTGGAKQKMNTQTHAHSVRLNVVNLKNFLCHWLRCDVVACLCRHTRTPIAVLWY